MARTKWQAVICTNSGVFIDAYVRHPMTMSLRTPGVVNYLQSELLRCWRWVLSIKCLKHSVIHISTRYLHQHDLQTLNHHLTHFLNCPRIEYFLVQKHGYPNTKIAPPFRELQLNLKKESHEYYWLQYFNSGITIQSNSLMKVQGS